MSDQSPEPDIIDAVRAVREALDAWMNHGLDSEVALSRIWVAVNGPRYSPARVGQAHD